MEIPAVWCADQQADKLLFCLPILSPCLPEDREVVVDVLGGLLSPPKCPLIQLYSKLLHKRTFLGNWLLFHLTLTLMTPLTIAIVHLSLFLLSIIKQFLLINSLILLLGNGKSRIIGKHANIIQTFKYSAHALRRCCCVYLAL